MDAGTQDNLQRFIDAQEKSFDTALAEIKAGKKRTHWMWYIFPQIAGLGQSETSRYFAIRDLEEATAFLAHSLLGKRLIIITRALLDLPHKNARAVFGNPDDVKLHSSMTLFSQVQNADPVFQEIINEYFNGLPDKNTLEKLRR